MHDYELLYMIRHTGGEAFNELLNRYKNLVWKRAHSFLKQTHVESIALDDLYQEGCLAVYNAAFSFMESKGVGLACYINVCVEYAMRAYIRRFRSKSSLQLEHRVALDKTLREDTGGAFGDVIPDPSKTSDPCFMAYMREVDETIEEVLKQCKDFEVSIYHYRKAGYRYSEITEKIGVSPKVIDNTMQKIRRIIAKKL